MAIVRRTLDEISARAKSRRAPIAPWSDDKIRKAAQVDPDSWIPTAEELEKFKPSQETIKALADKGRAFDYDDR